MMTVIRHGKHKRTAFTLIELLVVIAIIVLLVSILVPSLKEAKALAMRAVCLSNMRSSANAATIYATEHERYAPAGYYVPSSNSLGYSRLGPWYHRDVMGAYMGLDHVVSTYPDPEGAALCPASPVDSQTPWISYNAAICSTAHNDLRSREGVSSGGIDSLGYKRSIPYAIGPALQDIIASPDRIAFFEDGRTELFLYISIYKSYDKSSDSFYPPGGLDIYGRDVGPDFRHSEGVNFGMMDGHAVYVEDTVDALMNEQVSQSYK